MKKFFIAIILFTYITTPAHEQNVHRYIVSEAWKLLTYQKPELKNTLLNAWVGKVGDKTYLTSVIAGAHNEDEQDIIYMNCGISFDYFRFKKKECALSTINHFWDADRGDNHLTNMQGGTWENALQKSKHMWYGSHNHIIGVSFKPRAVADKIDHNGLPQLHNNGVVKWRGY